MYFTNTERRICISFWKYSMNKHLISLISISIRSLSTYLLNYHIDGLVQERRNSIATALELRLSCTNPSTWDSIKLIVYGSRGGHIYVRELGQLMASSRCLNWWWNVFANRILKLTYTSLKAKKLTEFAHTYLRHYSMFLINRNSKLLVQL